MTVIWNGKYLFGSCDIGLLVCGLFYENYNLVSEYVILMKNSFICLFLGPRYRVYQAREGFVAKWQGHHDLAHRPFLPWCNDRDWPWYVAQWTMTYERLLSFCPLYFFLFISLLCTNDDDSSCWRLVGISMLVWKEKLVKFSKYGGEAEGDGLKSVPSLWFKSYSSSTFC